MTASPVETVIAIEPEQADPRYIRSPYTFTPHDAPRLSERDIERIAERVAEKLREGR